MGVVLPGDRVEIGPSMSAGPGVYVCEVDGTSSSTAAVARSSTAGMLRGSVSDTGQYSKVWVDFNSKRVCLMWKSVCVLQEMPNYLPRFFWSGRSLEARLSSLETWFPYEIVPLY